MASEELRRFLALLDTLESGDWTRPTGCDRWNVREIVAHVAGAAAAYAGWTEFLHQLNPVASRPYRRRGFSQLDALNQIQVDDRAQVAPPDLIAELRRVGPAAIHTRDRLPRALRALILPIPTLGVVRLDYLTDTIYTRDMWIHRLDICRATGRAMVTTREHDGRILALMARDAAESIARSLGFTSVVYELTGPLAVAWRIGRRHEPAGTVRLDALDFADIAAGRLRYRDAIGRGAVAFAGDTALAERALAATRAPV